MFDFELYFQAPRDSTVAVDPTTFQDYLESQSSAIESIIGLPWEKPQCDCG